MLTLSHGQRYGARVVRSLISNALSRIGDLIYMCTHKINWKPTCFHRRLITLCESSLMPSFTAGTYETDVISIDAEGGPFQLVDTDRQLPFVFRSYVMFYGEDL